MTEEKFSDEQVTLYMAVFHSMAALVGAQTARLNGAKDDDPFAVPEAAWDGVQAMASFTRAIAKVAGEKKPDNDEEFAACFVEFTKQIGDDTKEKFRTPKDFLLHVTGYAVITHQSWEDALGDILPGSIWSTEES